MTKPPKFHPRVPFRCAGLRESSASFGHTGPVFSLRVVEVNEGVGVIEVSSHQDAVGLDVWQPIAMLHESDPEAALSVLSQALVGLALEEAPSLRAAKGEVAK